MHVDNTYMTNTIIMYVPVALPIFSYPLDSLFMIIDYVCMFIHMYTVCIHNDSLKI